MRLKQHMIDSTLKQLDLSERVSSLSKDIELLETKVEE